MKLRNKKTGEILLINQFISVDLLSNYKSLSDFNAEWEDASEDQKDYWYIESDGSIIQNHKPTYINHLLDGLKSVGNYFESREEAEKAVEKLKAWKRLKDKGFRVKDFYRLNDCACALRATFDESWSELYDDLIIFFGVEE